MLTIPLALSSEVLPFFYVPLYTRFPSLGDSLECVLPLTTTFHAPHSWLLNLFHRFECFPPVLLFYLQGRYYHLVKLWPRSQTMLGFLECVLIPSAVLHFPRSFSTSIIHIQLFYWPDRLFYFVVLFYSSENLCTFSLSP